MWRNLKSFLFFTSHKELHKMNYLLRIFLFSFFFLWRRTVLLIFKSRRNICSGSQVSFWWGTLRIWPYLVYLSTLTKCVCLGSPLVTSIFASKVIGSKQKSKRTERKLTSLSLFLQKVLALAEKNIEWPDSPKADIPYEGHCTWHFCTLEVSRSSVSLYLARYCCSVTLQTLWK